MGLEVSNRSAGVISSLAAKVLQLIGLRHGFLYRILDPCINDDLEEYKGSRCVVPIVTSCHLHII